MMELWAKHGDMDAFLTAHGCEKQNDGTYLRRFGHSRCVCPMFYQLSEHDPISITWCECCNACVKKGYVNITGQSVESEILESIASGGKDCVFRVTVP